MPRPTPRRQVMPVDSKDLEDKCHSWRGHPEVGRNIVKALQHAQRLAGIYDRGALAAAYVIIKDIYEPGSDPETHPDDVKVSGAWWKFEEAIEQADNACSHILRAYGPHDHRAMQCLYHADSLYFALVEAEALL